MTEYGAPLGDRRTGIEKLIKTRVVRNQKKAERAVEPSRRRCCGCALWSRRYFFPTSTTLVLLLFARAGSGVGLATDAVLVTFPCDPLITT